MVTTWIAESKVIRSLKECKLAFFDVSNNCITRFKEEGPTIWSADGTMKLEWVVPKDWIYHLEV